MTVPQPVARPDRQVASRKAYSATTTPSEGVAPASGVVEANVCATKRLGAASELRASVHLMQQGFDVYRCVAPTAPFDLVASREDGLYRVEVKTISTPAPPRRPIPMFGWPTNDKWDILILCADQAIFQFPFGITRDEVHLAIASELGIEPVNRKLRILSGLDPAPPPTREWIIRVMSADPSAVWRGPAVLEAMLKQGWTTHGKSPLGLIWSEMAILADQGRIDRVSRGSYVLAPSGGVA